MADDPNVRAGRRFWEGFDAHDLGVWDKVCAAGFVNHDPSLPTPDADLPTLSSRRSRRVARRLSGPPVV
jgi:hypothetical protein